MTSEITKAVAALETALGALREVPNAQDAKQLREILVSARGCIASAASSVLLLHAAAHSPLPPTKTHHTDCPPCPACDERVGVTEERDGRTLPPPLLYCPGCGHRWAASARDRALAEGADAAWAALVRAG